MKKICKVFVIFLLLLCNTNFAVDFDTSIDDEIRKNYNIEEINSQNSDKIKLPKLPEFNPEDDAVLTEEQYSSFRTPFPLEYTGKTTVIKSGTRFFLVNNQKISDRTGKNKTIVFSTLKDMQFSDLTIAKGTKFRGKITGSHPPQITGNGGLIVLDINEIIFGEYSYPIDSKILKINNKSVFFSRKKGKHSYWKNVKKSCNFGIKTNYKMKKCARKIGSIPILGIVGIVPRATGLLILSGNVVVSPAIAVFKKGNSVSIPKGTLFEIKLTNDVKIKS